MTPANPAMLAPVNVPLKPFARWGRGAKVNASPKQLPDGRWGLYHYEFDKSTREHVAIYGSVETFVGWGEARDFARANWPAPKVRRTGGGDQEARRQYALLALGRL